MSQQPRDYTQRFKGAPSGQGSKTMADKAPDQTIHQPPAALFIIGGIGILAGIATNIWQMITTFVAFWSMFNPKESPLDFQRKPGELAVYACALRTALRGIGWIHLPMPDEAYPFLRASYCF